MIRKQRFKQQRTFFTVLGEVVPAEVASLEVIDPMFSSDGKVCGNTGAPNTLDDRLGVLYLLHM